MSAANTAPALRWRSAPDSEILWVAWNDDYIAYHRPSGKTHFLNAATFDLLDKVLREPRDVAGSLTELARLRGAEPDLTQRSYMAGLLVRLEQLGLVRRA